MAFIGLSIESCKSAEDTGLQKRSPLDDFRITFHQAIQEKMRGNYDVSVQLFEKCLTLNENNDAVHFALSELYQFLVVPDKPLLHALRAFELDKENRWYQLRLADLYSTGGNYHKSVEYYEMAMDEEKNLDVKFKYVESLIFSHHYKKAIEVMNEIEVEAGFSPHLSLTKHDIYLKLGDLEAAQHELDHLIDDNPSNGENRLIIADYLLRTNQLQKAEQIAKEALEYAPENGEIRLILADIAIRNGNLDKCFDHLEQGFKQTAVSLSRKLRLIGSLQHYAFEDSEDAKKIELGLANLYQIVYNEEEQNDTLHAQYGAFLQMQHKPVEAISQFQLVVDINPNSYDNWMQLLQAQFNANDYEGMYKNGKSAIELFPAQPTVFMMAGIAAIETEDFESSEEWLHFGKELVVKDPQLLSEFEHQLGVLSWRQEDFAQAHTYFDLAKATNLYNGNVYRSKAFCYLHEDKDKLAMKEAEMALNQAPTNAFFHDLKGLVYFKTKRYEKAKKSFENALVYEDTNPQILEHCGDALFQLGAIDKAIEQWQLALDKGGHNPILIKKLTDKRYYEQ